MPRPKPVDPDEAAVSKTVTLSEKDLRDAARLFRLISDPKLLASGLPDLFPPAGEGADQETLIARARIMFNARRLRERYFDREIFGEPAWDILLLLYIADQSSGRLTTSRLAEQIEAPLTTATRWLNHLETKGLISRQGHPTDRRIIFIKLLDKGRTALEGFLSSIPG